MCKYTLYVEVNDNNSALLLPHKAGKIGFDVSAVTFGKVRRLVYEDDWENVPRPDERLTLQEIEKELNVTVQRDDKTGEPIHGMEVGFASPMIVTKLQNWLLKESQPGINYYKDSDYEWKKFEHIEGLTERIKSFKRGRGCSGIRGVDNINTIKVETPKQVFIRLTSRDNLSDSEEKELWEVAQQMEVDILWKKAEELANNNPEHPLASIRRGKKLKIDDTELFLVVSILKKTIDNDVNLLFQVYSLHKEKILPLGLTLLPLDEEGYPDEGEYGVYEMVANEKDRDIKLPLICDKNGKFILNIRLNNCQIYEYFIT